MPISNADRQQIRRNGPELRRVDAVPTSEDYDLSPPVEKEPVFSSRFNVDNQQAIPVFERATASAKSISQGISTSIMIYGRHRGRKSVILTAPVTITTLSGSTSPNGFQFSDDRAVVEANAGFQLNPGDSFEWSSEAEIWVAPLPGKTSGYVQACEFFSAFGGPAGA